MNKLSFLFLFTSTLLFAQNKEEAIKKIEAGIELHDEGKFQDALSKYDEALKLDENNLLALSEKAVTLEASKKYDEAIEISKFVLKLYPNEDNRTVYVVYGNSLDHTNQKDLSLKIYDEGLKKYPDYYQLYYNKAITLYNNKEPEKAEIAFEEATKLNPNHTSSFNALGVLNNSNRIASILASSRYLVLDNKSSRAKLNLKSLLSLMNKGVTKTGEKNISLVLDPTTLENVGKKKNRPNDFSSVDITLSMSAALAFDEKNKDNTEIQNFINQFESMCKVMSETRKNKKGYFWEFLAPYFIEMEKNKLVEPFAYYIFNPTQSEDVLKYQKENSAKIEKFLAWNKVYKWN